MKYTLLLALLFTLSAFGFAPPDFTGNVVDEAGVLSESDKDLLHKSIQNAREKADIWTAVYIVPTLNGETIEDAAHKTFNHWKLGKEGKDNGLLFMVAINDRKMRIEVGYGLEGVIPDIIAHRVIDETLKPAFKGQEFGFGISEGIDRLVKHRLKEEVIEPKTEEAYSTLRLAGCLALNFTLVGLFSVLFIFRNLTGRRYKLRWFGMNLLGGLAGAVFFSMFFSLFWTAPDSPLFFIAPFNAIFAFTFGGIAMFRPLQLLMSATQYANWVTPWLKYEDEYAKWKKEFKAAEKEEKLLEFIQKNKAPQAPNSFLGRLVDFPSGSGSWKSTGTSGSSFRSSSSGSSSRSSSSSSSSGGGRSGGGGSSGSW